MKKRWLLAGTLLLSFLLLTSKVQADQSRDWKKFLNQKMTWADARHFLARVNFGGTPEEIEKYTSLSYKEAVKKILSEMRDSPRREIPDYINKPPVDRREIRKKMRSLSKEERQKFRKELRRELRRRQWGLKNWWLQEMCQTDSPFTEKIILFWHNHFVSSMRKCRSPRLIYKQLALFRQFAKGNFKDFVKAVSKDPAMVIYLDSRTNRKGRPNENFARELMELFTLGEGHYTEKDIKEAARAFTGYSLNRRTGSFQFRPRQHDWTKKTFMGESGYFQGDDIIDIIFKKDQVSIYITEKLWKAFISPTPQAKGVKELAQTFRKSGYNLESLYRAILTSPYFWDPKNRGTIIKSPVDLVVGTVRLFGFQVKNPRILPRATMAMGQNVLDPPNVKGWEGGERWISTTTLLIRRQFVLNLLRGAQVGAKSKKKGRNMRRMRRMMKRKKMMEKKMMSRLKVNPLLTHKQKVERIQDILLPHECVDPLPEEIELRDAVRHFMLDISFQLK